MNLEEIKKGLKHTSKLSSKDEDFSKLMCDSIDLQFRILESEIKALKKAAYYKGFSDCVDIAKPKTEQDEDWSLPF